MPLLEETTHQKNNNQTDQSNQVNSVSQPKEFNLIKTIGQLLPLAPFVFEQFTGQKVPAMQGTMAEVTNSLQQIQLSLATLANNQQQLAQRLIALETNANQHLTNLTHQFNSLRLTHTREKKQIEYNPPLENNEESY
jgi:uncharacterized protein YjfI (DUF2170 family)